MDAISGFKEAAVASNPAKTPDAKSADAGKQFESLLIAQMLKEMRESGSGWLGTGEDQAGASAMAMAEEHLASVMSDSGGFGIGRMIQSSLQSSQKLQE